MSVILVIQPDAAQGRVLHDVARRIGSELVIVDSTRKAVDAIARQVPDLILLSAFLSPRDEDTLMGRLRSLEGASHLQTMTIPQFRATDESKKKSGFGFRKKQKAAVTVGADPAAFAEEVVALLSRASEIRSRPAPVEPVRSAPRPVEPVVAVPDAPLAVPDAPLIDEDAASIGDGAALHGAALIDEGEEQEEPAFATGPAFDDQPELAGDSDPIFFNHLVDEESSDREPDSIFLDDPEEDPGSVQAPVAADFTVGHLASAGQTSFEAAGPPPVAETSVFTYTAPRPARSIADEIDQLVKQLGLDVKMPELDSSPAARPDITSSDGDDDFDFGASLDRARNQALARSDDGAASPIVDAEAIRESALAEARAVAEREAREASAAEIARVQAEAEAARKSAEERATAEREARELAETERQAREALAADLARAQSEAERKRELALEEARAAEARAETERQAREALAADLARAQNEAERKRELAIAEARAAEARADAERQAREALAADLARAQSEAERKRELALAEARAAEAQAAAEREARKALAADMARAQTEAEQKREAALAEARAAEARAAEERKAREALAADLARAQSEGEKKREAAVAEARAAEARAAEERKAREALAADLARAQSEAEENRQAAIAEARAAVEREAREALAADLARVQMEAEQLRDRAIAEARAAAERDARESLETEVARVRSEAQLTFTDELNKVKQAKEDAERRRIEAERVSAHAQEAFARELTRVRTEVEQSLAAQLDAARAEAEQIRAAEAEAVRERAAMEAQLKNELDRLKFITTQARKADASETKKAAQQIKQLEAELASVRAKADERKHNEVQELRTQMAEMREAAAQHARAAAAEAVAAAVAAAAPRQTAVIAQFPMREAPRVEPEPVEEETDGRDRRDYLSLWSPRAAAPAEVEEEPVAEDEPGESFISSVDLRRHAKWALPIAACLLLVTNTGTAISTFSSVSKLVTPEETPAVVVQPLQEETPFIEVVEKRVGKLQLDSIPTGAEAILDGKSYGPTPVTIPDLDPGLHTLQLKSTSGTVTRKVTIKANQTTLLTESIYSGWLAVFSPIPVKVVIDGAPVHLNEEGRVMAPSGTHVVEFVNEQFNYRATEKLVVRPGETTPHTVTLPAGTLRVSAPDGAVIFIDGQPAAGNPREGLSVAIGSHDISARHPELGERRLAVDVKQGGLTEVALRFE